MTVQSRAPDRSAYLARPDWGRRLHSDSVALLTAQREPKDLVFVVSDGLSSTAIQRHAVPLLTVLIYAALHAGLSGVALRFDPRLISEYP